MSSSTSSSDNVNTARKLFFRIWVTILIGMAFAVIAVLLFVRANGAGSQSMLGRVLQAQEAIPQIAAEEKDLMLFFGTSMVQAGFSPREFDEFIADEGGSVSSFNFGFGGLNPLFQDYLTRRIVERFEEEDRRVKLLVIEFNPFQTTKARRNLSARLEESYVSLLASPHELMDITLEDPESGLRMLGIRYLRDGISAEMVTTFFWAEPFRAPPTAPEVPEDEAVAERLNEVIGVINTNFDAEYPDFDGSDWYWPWKGGGTLERERSEETLAAVWEYYELVQADYLMSRARQRRIDSADIENLDFDPELVDHFVQLVKNLQQIADTVEVVLLPKNTDWIKNPPEAMQRQAEVLAKIERETGAVVRDWQVIEPVTNDMFSDTTHLNRYQGATAFTRFLAEHYREVLIEE